MKVKTWIPLVVAVALGLAALKFTRDAMSRGGTVDDSNFVATVTAAKDIAPGQPITAEDLTTSKVEATSVPTGAFTEPAALADRVAASGFVKGQTVLESQLAPQGTAGGFQALVPPGMRAMTIAVDEWSGLAGLLLPGAKVDVIALIRNGDNQSSTSRTIVQNVEVRAIGRQITGTQPAVDPNIPAGAPIPAPTSVTLLVTPEQAEAIQLATVGGKPWLALRNSKDTKSFTSEGTSLADLRGDERDSFEPTAPTKVASTTEGGVKTPAVENDPFGVTPFVAPTGRSPRTRTVTFIRNTKEQTMTVDAAPSAPSDWVGATTSDPSDSKSK
jgi:pilus assembly protein CpaB